MTNHFQSIFDRIRFPQPVEDGRGDTSQFTPIPPHTSIDSFTLLHEFGGSASSVIPSSCSFSTRFILTSVGFLVLFLLSYLCSWTCLLFELAKPVCCVYIAGMGVVEILRPMLKKMDEILIPETVRWNHELGREESLDSYHGASVTTFPPGMLDDIARKRGLVPNDIGFDLPSTKANTELALGSTSATSLPNWSSTSLTAAVRSRSQTYIPAPAKKSRKVRARATATVAGANAALLRALESELRKEQERAENPIESNSTDYFNPIVDS